MVRAKGKSKPKSRPATIVASERRVPTQDRSRLRLERILDAAAEVFSEVGIDAATTESIAARAGTSIGSLYQFFPNKRAVFYAIVARYGERVRGLIDAAIVSR